MKKKKTYAHCTLHTAHSTWHTHTQHIFFFAPNYCYSSVRLMWANLESVEKKNVLKTWYAVRAFQITTINCMHSQIRINYVCVRARVCNVYAFCFCLIPNYHLKYTRTNLSIEKYIYGIYIFCIYIYVECSRVEDRLISV